MDQTTISNITAKQRAFYNTGATRDVRCLIDRSKVFVGGGCINDVIVHLASTRMGFGGVGESGMGSCHGKAGFDAFTHYRSILRSRFFDLPMRYRPYNKVWDALIRIFMR